MPNHPTRVVTPMYKALYKMISKGLVDMVEVLFQLGATFPDQHILIGMSVNKCPEEKRDEIIKLMEKHGINCDHVVIWDTTKIRRV